MTAADRLNAVQERLMARGVVDVKLCFDPGVTQMPKSAVEDNVAQVLEMFLDGKCSPLTFTDKQLIEQLN